MENKAKFEEQPMPKGAGKEVVPFLIEKLKERRELGIDRYGEALHSFNGRDQKRDALEELLDFIQYFAAWYLEDSADNEELALIRTVYTERIAALERENAALKTQLDQSKATVSDLNQRVLHLTTTLSEAFASADEAVKTLALRCLTNTLLDNH